MVVRGLRVYGWKFLSGLTANNRIAAVDLLWMVPSAQSTALARSEFDHLAKIHEISGACWMSHVFFRPQHIQSS